MSPPSPTATEPQTSTVERIRSELAASGQETGARRQLNIERNAGIASSRGQAAPSLVATGQETAPTAAETTPSTTPVTAGGKFVDVVNQLVTKNVTDKRNDLLSPEQNMDTQLNLQRGALYAALAGEATALTPEDLRWLDPNQQRLIRQGDQTALRSAIIGLNSIMQERGDRKKDEEAKVIAEEKRSMDRFNTLSSLGVLDRLSEDDRRSMEEQLGLPSGAIDSVIEDQVEGEFTYELRATERGGFVQFKKNAKTGEIVGQETITKSRALAGPTPGSDTVVSDKMLPDGSIVRIISDKAGTVLSRTEIISGTPVEPANIQLQNAVADTVTDLVKANTKWGEWEGTVSQMTKDAKTEYGSVLTDDQIEAVIQAQTSSIVPEGRFWSGKDKEVIKFKTN